MWAAASALTTAIGPVLGGWLTEVYGWQLVFWMNPPLALAAVWLLAVYAPDDRREARRFDTIGAALLAAGVASLASGYWLGLVIAAAASVAGAVVVAGTVPPVAARRGK